MFHTLELFKDINSLEYYYLNNSLKSLSKDYKAKYYNKNKIYEECVFNCFTEHGITILTKKFKIKEYVYHQIVIIFTPKRLLKEKEFIEVTTEKDLNEIKKEFRNIMNVLKQKYNIKSKDNLIFIFHNLDNYYVKRIDFCVNVVCKSSTKVMELIRRSDIPKNFKIYLEYDKKAKIKKMPKGSFYILSKSVIVNFYDKHFQMSNEEYFKDINIFNSEGIIRFEIQCMYQKVNSIKNKYNMEGKTISDIAKSEIAESTLLCYIKRTMGFEDYFTLYEARDKINNCKNYRKNTRKKMIEVIELINKKRSVPQARKEYLGGEVKFNAVIKKIRKLDINPVTIPVNWGIRYIPNPVHEIEKKFKNE